MPTVKQYHQCAQVIGHCKGLGKGIKGYHKCASDSNCKKKDREKVEALSKKINMTKKSTPEQLGRNIFKKFVNKNLPLIRDDIEAQRKLRNKYFNSPNYKEVTTMSLKKDLYKNSYKLTERQQRLKKIKDKQDRKDFKQLQADLDKKDKKEIAESYSEMIDRISADDNDGLLLPKKFIDDAPVRKGVKRLQIGKDFSILSGDYESGEIDIKEYNMEVALMLYSGVSLNNALKKYCIRRDGDEIVGLKYK